MVGSIKEKVTSNKLLLSDSGADYQDLDSESNVSAEETKQMKMPGLPKTTAVKTMDAPTDKREPWPILNLEDMLQRDQPFHSHSPVRPIEVPDWYVFMVHMLHRTAATTKSR